MAVEYRLTVAGDTPAAELAVRALPDSPERITADGALLVADLAEVGVDLVIRAGRAGYLSGEGDQGPWEWEPDTYVNLTGRLSADPDLRETGTHTMLAIVTRVLSSGTEDAALMLNSDYLLLTRTGGVVTKHRRSAWWDHYRWPNEVIPD